MTSLTFNLFTQVRDSGPHGPLVCNICTCVFNRLPINLSPLSIVNYNQGV